MDEKSIYISNDAKQDNPFCRLKSLDTYNIELTNQNSVKVSKVFEPTNKITLLSTLGTSIPSLFVIEIHIMQLSLH